MPNLDYTTSGPQMPQFREADGRWDWMQIADMFLPGNWWNSRTNQYRPLGIAQGVTGIPVDTALAAGRGLMGAVREGSDFFRGLGRGRGTSQVPSPLRYADDIRSISNAAANYRRPSERERVDHDNRRIVDEVRSTESDINDFRRGGGGGGRQLGSTQLGAGQRFGSQMSFADHYDAMASRGGALMER